MAALHYMTVQDILWINLQVTKKVNHFNHARLEEATYYQYAYGESNSLVPQAGRFLGGFMRLHPFDLGNESTAFVACLAFLQANGSSVELSDESASAWFEEVRCKKRSASDAIAGLTASDSHCHEGSSPDFRTIITGVLRSYPATVAGLRQLASSAA